LVSFLVLVLSNIYRLSSIVQLAQPLLPKHLNNEKIALGNQMKIKKAQLLLLTLLAPLCCVLLVVQPQRVGAAVKSPLSSLNCDSIPAGQDCNALEYQNMNRDGSPKISRYGWDAKYVLYAQRETAYEDKNNEYAKVYYTTIICPSGKWVSAGVNADNVPVDKLDRSFAVKSESGCITEIENNCQWDGGSTTCQEKDVGGVLHVSSLIGSSGGSTGTGTGGDTGGGTTTPISGSTAATNSGASGFGGDVPWTDAQLAAGCDSSKHPDPVVCLKNPKTESGKIWSIISLVLNLLSGAIGVAAVIMLVMGGIQYAASNGDPSAVTAAKKKISNVLLGLAAYVFLFAFLQWLIPGGIL
jgi:hypothetical protein